MLICVIVWLVCVSNIKLLMLLLLLLMLFQTWVGHTLKSIDAIADVFFAVGGDRSHLEKC